MLKVNHIYEPLDDIDIYRYIEIFLCIILFTGFYVDGFPKLNRFIEHHDKIMSKFLPKLKRKMDKCGCDSILYALKWFFVVFQERVGFLFSFFSRCMPSYYLFFLISYFAYKIFRNAFSAFNFFIGCDMQQLS